MTLDGYTYLNIFFVALIEWAFFTIGAIILSIVCIRWILAQNLGIHNISQSQMNNLWYIIIFGMFGISLFLMTICFSIIVGYLNLNYFVVISYLEGMVSLCLIILQNRATKYEVILKDVSYNNKT
jgi:hypothetical protein